METNTRNIDEELAKRLSKTLSGHWSGQNRKIQNVDDPIADQDVATKAYVDAGSANVLPTSGGTMSGDIAMGTNGITGMADPTSAQDAATKAYVDAGYPKKLKPALTRWVLPGWNYMLESSNIYSAGVIYYIPIFVSEDTTYTAIAITVKTLAVGTADLRIFTWSSGVPGALILSAGTVDTGSTGEKSIVISQALTRGYYFLAVRCSGAPTLYNVSSGSAGGTPVGVFHAAARPAINTIFVVLTVTGAYADPAPAPTGGDLMEFACVFLKET